LTAIFPFVYDLFRGRLLLLFFQSNLFSYVSVKLTFACYDRYDIIILFLTRQVLMPARPQSHIKVV
jgi:hypothetical protein